jgi:hypothetical protein
MPISTFSAHCWWTAWSWCTHPTAIPAAYDLQVWYGKDYDRLVLKAERSGDHGRLQDASSELLWAHAVAAYWYAQLGVRYDSGVDPGQGWLAFGLQGLAPYWFELDTTAYIADVGRSALRLKIEYELLFTQKLILQLASKPISMARAILSVRWVRGFQISVWDCRCGMRFGASSRPTSELSGPVSVAARQMLRRPLVKMPRQHNLSRVCVYGSEQRLPC